MTVDPVQNFHRDVAEISIRNLGGQHPVDISPRFLNLGGQNLAENSSRFLNLGSQNPASNLMRRISRKDAIVFLSKKHPSDEC